MNIALDWDDTFTRDPHLWSIFIRQCHKSGHEVRIVTFRRPEDLQDIYDELHHHKLHVPVMATDGIQKMEFCDKHAFVVDVWIDDSPDYIVPRSKMWDVLGS